jgi:hypothetical protein
MTQFFFWRFSIHHHVNIQAEKFLFRYNFLRSHFLWALCHGSYDTCFKYAYAIHCPFWAANLNASIIVGILFHFVGSYHIHMVNSGVPSPPVLPGLSFIKNCLKEKENVEFNLCAWHCLNIEFYYLNNLFLYNSKLFS